MPRNSARPFRRGDTRDTPAELDFNDDDRTLPPHSGYARLGSVEHDHASAYDEGGQPISVDNLPGADDLSPETLLDETGGNRPLVSAHAADIDLSIVDEDEIGGGEGLDEAELALAEGGGPDPEEEDEDEDEADGKSDEDAEDDEEDEDEDDEDEEDDEPRA